MIVVEQFAAELEIQFAAELIDTLADMRSLQGNVLLVVESDTHEARDLLQNGATPRREQ